MGPAAPVVVLSAKAIAADLCDPNTLTRSPPDGQFLAMNEDVLINPLPRLPRPATAAKLAAGLARHPRATTGRAAT